MTNVQTFLQGIYNGLVQDSDSDFRDIKKQSGEGMKRWLEGRAAGFSLAAESLALAADSSLGIALETENTLFREDADSKRAKVLERRQMHHEEYDYSKDNEPISENAFAL